MGENKTKTLVRKHQISLRTPSVEYRLPGSEDIGRVAAQWAYMVRSRQRWYTTPVSLDAQRLRARELLNAWGLDERQLGEMSRAVDIEVYCPAIADISAAAMLFPWETALSLATDAFRDGRRINVTRCLSLRSPPDIRPIRKVLYVESEPGVLKSLFNFDDERKLLHRAVNGTAISIRECVNPTGNELRSAVAAWKPDLIHLAGFDTHLANFQIQDAAGLGVATGGQGIEDAHVPVVDGYALNVAGPGIDLVPFDRLSKLLCPKEAPPTIVCANIWNSSARIAPSLLRHGASAIVAMQDKIDDDISELFFSYFYMELLQKDRSIVEAFQLAWQLTRASSNRTRGTGMTLLTARSSYPTTSSLRKSRGKGTADSQLMTIPAPVITESDSEKRDATLIDAGTMSAAQIDELIEIKIEPLREINYSLLHNGRPLFSTFSFVRKTNAVLDGIAIHVVLNAGSEVATYSRVLRLTRPTLDLFRDIHLPLTTNLTRTAQECLVSSLEVHVAWGARTLRRETYRVRILPIDQWRDTSEDRRWLPSFVLPRDPAVAETISQAQRYVKVIRDDPTAGFDGYQSYDRVKADATGVDRQVQAIWAAVTHDLSLGYSNPPPTYSRNLDSQRLRTPSAIVRSRYGTCIDLALYFAACLELIDIYPVVLLTEGHAFPGYWRSDRYHSEFVEALPSAETGSVPGGAQREPWYVGRSAFDEVKAFVSEGKLVPLETVELTTRSSFNAALSEGKNNLESRKEFQAMVDVVLARRAQITPLPMLF